VLGDVRGVALGPDGLVVVLDRSWQKVVWFRPDGSVQNVSLGGSGEGPGEFGIPIHMIATGRGISVLDYQLRRITHFDWVGNPASTVTVGAGRPFRHLARGDTLWLASGPAGPSSDPMIYLMIGENSGRAVDGPFLEAEDQPFGNGLGIAGGQR
jgi:hypothetical protein